MAQMREHSIQIPFRLIDKHYGRDSMDNAGDDVANLLVELSDHAEQFRYAFNFDTRHENHYFHAMIFTVFDAPDSIMGKLKNGLTELGLID